RTRNAAISSFIFMAAPSMKWTWRLGRTYRFRKTGRGLSVARVRHSPKPVPWGRARRINAGIGHGIRASRGIRSARPQGTGLGDGPTESTPVLAMAFGRRAAFGRPVPKGRAWGTGPQNQRGDWPWHS